MALADGIVTAVEKRETWPVIGRNARDYVIRERTWTASVNRYEPVYERLTAGRAAKVA